MIEQPTKQRKKRTTIVSAATEALTQVSNNLLRYRAYVNDGQKPLSKYTLGVLAGLDDAMQIIKRKLEEIC